MVRRLRPDLQQAVEKLSKSSRPLALAVCSRLVFPLVWLFAFVSLSPFARLLGSHPAERDVGIAREIGGIFAASEALINVYEI